MRTITFQPTWDAWRRHAREALASEIPPSEIFWVPEEHDAQSTLPLAVAHPGGASPSRPARARAFSDRDTVPRELERFGRLAAHHRSEERFALLYRLLWRLQHGERTLLGDMLDPDVFRLRRMASAVREDLKETRSHLRLRDPAFQAHHAAPSLRAHRAARSPRSLPDLVGWCEPRHRVLPLLAEQLASRQPQRSFALLSPQATVFWDGRSLDLGPGADRAGSHSAPELVARWEARHRLAA